MATFQTHKQTLSGLFGQLIGFAQGHKNEEVARRLTDAAKHLAEEKLLVVVAGEFKQGKSSLINAVLAEPDLFPVDVAVTTSLVSTITYGDQERFTVLLGERGQERPQQISRQEIADYVTEQRNPSNKRNARLLVMESPNPRLKDGLVLVDTPGIGSLNAQHTDITYAFIPNADAVLFVSDALAPLSAEELTFAKMIARHCQRVIYVVTKIDKVANPEAIVADNRAKLAATLEQAPEAITIIPVSSHAKLTYEESQQERHLRRSNFIALETELWSLLSEHRGYIVLMRAIGELSRSLDELRAPLAAEREAYLGRSKQELDQFERELTDARQRMKNLLDKNARWRTDLEHGLQDIRAEVQNQFEDRFVKIRRDIDVLLDQGRLRSHPEQIAGLLETDMAALMAELGNELSRLSSELSARIERDSGLTVGSGRAGMVEWQRDASRLAVDRLRREDWKAKSWAVTRNSVMTGGVAATAGSLVGAIVGSFFGGVGAVPGAYIGGAIGSSLGMIGGLAGGAKQGLSQIKEKERASITKILIPFVEDSKRECSRALIKALTGLSRAMQQDLHEQFERERNTAERTLNALQAGRRRPDEQAARRSSEIQIRLQQLDQMNTILDRTATDVATLERTPVSSVSPAGRVAATPSSAELNGDGRSAITSADVGASGRVESGNPPTATTIATKEASDFGSWADDDTD